MPILDLSTVKKGDIFYECEYGENIEIRALEDARHVTEYKGIKCNGYTLKILYTKTGKIDTVLQSRRASHYSHFYKEKEYYEPGMEL